MFDQCISRRETITPADIAAECNTKMHLFHMVGKVLQVQLYTAVVPSAVYALLVSTNDFVSFSQVGRKTMSIKTVAAMQSIFINPHALERLVQILQEAISVAATQGQTCVAYMSHGSIESNCAVLRLCEIVLWSLQFL